MELYRKNGEYDDYYLIGFDYEIIPLAFYDINEWLAALYLFPDYITEIPLSDNNKTSFDESTYYHIEYMLGLSVPLPDQPNIRVRIYTDDAVHWCGPYYANTKCSPSIDYLLLKNKLGMRFSKDNSELFSKVCESHKNVINEYLKGTTKAVNQLLGIILKDNKGIDPRTLKADLEAYINENYKKD